MQLQDKFKIDLETGFRIDTVSPFEFGEDIIETPCLGSFSKPKWNGAEWVEGATPEEIALIKNKPTIEEPSSLEQRVQIIEQNQDEIATILADVVGVTL